MLYLVVLAVAVHHPVLSIGADLQLEGCDVVGLLRFLGYGTLCGNTGQNLEEMKIHLEKGGEKYIKLVLYELK